MAVIHISEADAARDFFGLMEEVRSGAEVVEDGSHAVAITRPAVPAGPGRMLSEMVAAAEASGPSTMLDGSFAHELEEAINSHPEPLASP